ncbi:hypothetical protein SAMN05444481_104249 [Flavobacterium frigidimaris]|jgi:hypothetical protein|nr:hypothetical protein SAMN05444481_104249 [Flavobacterium frigidimaris]
MSKRKTKFQITHKINFMKFLNYEILSEKYFYAISIIKIQSQLQLTIKSIFRIQILN